MTAAIRAENPAGLALWQRAAHLAVAAFAGSILTIARALSPDARGFGTHEQLGLPPCAFRALTELPCPACGLTTAFAHMVRGEIIAAFAASPLGALLCLITCFSVPLALFFAVRGVALSEACARLHVERVGLGLVLLGLLQWIARTLTHLAA